jgi:hypothetical protein
MGMLSSLLVKSSLKPKAMKTINQKFSSKQGAEETITAVFVIAALVFFFAIVIYNSVSHQIGL